MRTHRTEVHDAGEGNDPEVLAVDDVTAVKLDEPALDGCTGWHGIKQTTNHKAVG